MYNVEGSQTSWSASYLVFVSERVTPSNILKRISMVGTQSARDSCCRSLLRLRRWRYSSAYCLDYVQTDGGALATVVAATVTGNFVRLMQVNPSVSNSAGTQLIYLDQTTLWSLLLSQTPRKRLRPTFAIGMYGSLFSIKNLNPLTP